MKKALRRSPGVSDTIGCMDSSGGAVTWAGFSITTGGYSCTKNSRACAAVGMCSGMQPMSFAACRSAGWSLPTMSAFAPKPSPSSCASSGAACCGGAAAAALISRLRRSTVSFALQTGHGKLTSFIGSFVSSSESGFWQEVQTILIMARAWRASTRRRFPARGPPARRGGEGDVPRDGAPVPQLLELVVEGLHAVDGAVVHGVDQRAPHGLAFQDVIARAHGRLEDLQHGDAAAADLRQEPLRDDVAEGLREARADLRLLVFREDADDAVDGLGGVDGVQRGEDEVPGLGGLHGDLDGLDVAHLADEDDLRGLPQRGAQREREGLRVRADLALVHGRLEMLVHVLDGVLDGDDVIRVVAVDLVDERGQRGGLAGAGRPGDEDDAVLELADVVELVRQSELLQRRHALGDDAQDDGVGAALGEDVDAEARLLRDGVREVDRAAREQRARQLPVAPQHVHGDHLGLVRRETRQAGKVDRDEDAVDLDLRRPADREVQVGDALRDLQHRLEDGVEIEVLHGERWELYVSYNRAMSLMTIDHGERRFGGRGYAALRRPKRRPSRAGPTRPLPAVV